MASATGRLVRGLAAAFVLTASVTLVGSWLSSPAGAIGTSPLTFQPPALIDHVPHGTGAGSFVHGFTQLSLSCVAGTTFCVAGDFQGDVVTSTNPAGGASAWTITNIDGGNSVQGVSCPSVSVCAAIDEAGNAFTSLNPTGGASAWSKVPVDTTHGLDAISCPSTTLCVATDRDGAVATANPSLPAPVTWTLSAAVDVDALESISCTESPTLLCVGVDPRGDVATSTNPTGGASAWTLGAVPGATTLEQVSCPSTALCVATDYNDKIATSTNPAGGASTWSETKEDSAGLISISCQSTTLCVAADDGGTTLTSTDPTAGASAVWTPVNLNYTVAAQSCPSATLCIGVAGQWVLTNPSPGSGGTWTPKAVDGTNTLTAVSCLSAALCEAVDNEGNVFTSTDPTAGLPSWTPDGLINGLTTELYALDCASLTLCLAADINGNIDTTLDPTEGASATWVSLRIDASGGIIRSIACPTTSLCVAVNGFGDAFVTSDPADGAKAVWTTTDVDSSNLLYQVACPSPSICVAGDSTGHAITLTNLTASQVTASVTVIDASTEITGMACPSPSLCVAIDSGSHVVTANPTATPPVWSVGATGLGLAQISCPSVALCVATNSQGLIYVTTNPAGPASGWTGTTNDYVLGYQSLSCPTVSLCAAVDYEGHVIVGTGVPTVSAVTPSSGPTAGGTAVTVSGSGFTPDATVKFGSVAATGVHYVSDTSLTAIAPAQAVGAVDLTINTVGGVSNTGSADQFTYQGPATVPLNTMLVAEPGANEVLAYPPGGGPPSTVGTGLVDPTAVTYDAKGDAFIADTGNNRVVEVTPGGTQSTVGTGLAAPQGVAVDTLGDVFIADTGNNRVVEMPAGGSTPQKVLERVALSAPTGLTVDAEGDVYIANTGLNQVVEEPAAGGPRLAVGANLTAPVAVAVDSQGDVYISEAAVNNSRTNSTTDGQVVALFSASANGSETDVGAGLVNPDGLTLDAASNLFVADTSANQIDEIPYGGGAQSTDIGSLNGPAGIALYAPPPALVNTAAPATAVLGTPYSYTFTATTPVGEPPATFAVVGGTLPSGLVLNASSGVLSGTPTFADSFTFDLVAQNGVNATPEQSISVTVNPSATNLPAPDTIYATDFGNRITEIAPGGGAQLDVTTLGSNAYPAGVALDGSGDLFVAAEGLNKVIKITPGGVRTAIASATTSAKQPYPLSDPIGVAVNSVGDVFIASFGNNDVVEVAPSGIETLLDSAATTNADPTNEPSGVAVDPAGDVFIANHGEGGDLGDVVKITPSGTQSVIDAGDFVSPGGVATDAQGDLFIVDHSIGELVEVTPADGPPEVIEDTPNQPTGVAVDTAGNLFVATESGILEYSVSGAYLGSLGNVTEPTGLAVDAPGPVFSAETPSGSLPLSAPYTYDYAASVLPTEAPATFTVASGALPPGLTMTASGVLSGTPTVSGPYSFVVEAATGSSYTDSPLTTIGVPGPPALVADSPPVKGTVGTAYTYTFTAKGYPAPTFLVASGALPTGLTLNKTSGKLSGTPTKAAKFTFAVQATNGVGTAATSPTRTITISS